MQKKAMSKNELEEVPLPALQNAFNGQLTSETINEALDAVADPNARQAIHDYFFTSGEFEENEAFGRPYTEIPKHFKSLIGAILTQDSGYTDIVANILANQMYMPYWNSLTLHERKEWKNSPDRNIDCDQVVLDCLKLAVHLEDRGSYYSVIDPDNEIKAAHMTIAFRAPFFAAAREMNTEVNVDKVKSLEEELVKGHGSIQNLEHAIAKAYGRSDNYEIEQTNYVKILCDHLKPNRETLHALDEYIAENNLLLDLKHLTHERARRNIRTAKIDAHARELLDADTQKIEHQGPNAE